MATRSELLADSLEDSADQIISTVEDLSDADWQRVASADGRQINVLVDHIAQSHQAVYMLVEMILADKPLPPITMEMIHETNGRHAAENSGVTKETALVALRANSEDVAAKIRQLSDADLDRTAPFTLSDSGSISVSAITEHILVGHAMGHLESIKSALQPA